MPELSSEAMLALKVSILETIVRDLLVQHFRETSAPIATARKYAETRWKPAPGATVDPELELIRQGFWQQFLDSVVAGVRKTEGP